MPHISVTTPSELSGELPERISRRRGTCPVWASPSKVCSARPDWMCLTGANMMFTVETSHAAAPGEGPARRSSPTSGPLQVVTQAHSMFCGVQKPRHMSCRRCRRPRRRHSSRRARRRCSQSLRSFTVAARAFTVDDRAAPYGVVGRNGDFVETPAW